MEMIHNMNKKIETERLLLIPGCNARDNVSFIHMLRNDGDFRDFCGIEFSEKYLAEFSDFFERTGHEECIYSIFPKGTDEFIAMWDSIVNVILTMKLSFTCNCVLKIRRTA